MAGGIIAGFGRLSFLLSIVFFRNQEICICLVFTSLRPGVATDGCLKKLKNAAR